MRVRIANALTAQGIAVELVMPQAEGPHLRDLQQGVRVVSLNTRNPALLVWRLAGYLRQVRPRLMIASQQHTILAAVWARWLSRVPVRLVASQHNTLSELCGHSRRWAVRVLLPKMARRFYAQADQIVAVSEGVADDLAAVAGIPRRRIEVFYNPVVTSDLWDRAAAPTGHAWFDHKDRPVILAVGNLNEVKDHATLVKAFARVRAALPARLVILGDGPQRTALERLARQLDVSEDMDLPGFEANPYAFMARADVFALSSRVEGLPSALTEALACGCPVVSTDCPSGPAEILAGGKYGRLVPVCDDGALAEAIVATLHEPHDRDRLHRRGAMFSVERAVERYLDLLNLRPGFRP